MESQSNDEDPMLECRNNNPQHYGHVGRTKINHTKDRDYDNHNFGIWKDVDEYHGEEIEYEGSCDLEPEDVVENAGKGFELLDG